MLWRHLWYFCEKLISLALFSSRMQDHVKQNLASKLFRAYQQFSTTSMWPRKLIFPSITEDMTIENLVGARSIILFQRFRFKVEDIQFFRYSCTRWNEFETFRKLKELVTSLHETNDLAKRGIRFWKTTKIFRQKISNKDNWYCAVWKKVAEIILILEIQLWPVPLYKAWTGWFENLCVIFTLILIILKKFLF